MRWYLNRTGRPEGPYDEASIVEYARAGQIGRRVLVCAEGTSDWRPIATYPAFASVLPAGKEPARLLGFAVRDLALVALAAPIGLVVIGFIIKTAQDDKSAKTTEAGSALNEARAATPRVAVSPPDPPPPTRAAERTRFETAKKKLKATRPKSEKEIVEILGEPSSTTQDFMGQGDLLQWYFETQEVGRDVIQCVITKNGGVTQLSY